MSKGTKAVRLVEPGPCRTWWVRVWGEDDETQIAVELVPAGATPGSDWIGHVDADGYVTAIVAPLPVEDAVVRRVVPRRRPVARAASSVAGAAKPRCSVDVRDVVCVSIRFTSDPGRHDSCFSAKVRPCVVIGVRNDKLVVRPLFDADGCVARRGAPRLRDWWSAGLDKPSVVGGQVVVPTSEVVRRIARITHRDEWLLGEDEATG